MKEVPKIFIKSCHATLEYDQALMFLKMGCQVAGHFDVGSTQRPKIKGVTDVQYDFDQGVLESDVFVLHQCENFSNMFEDVCIRRKVDQPVIINAFGQGSADQHKHVAGILRALDNAYLCSYSKTDYNRYVSLDAPEEKMRMIRFGKSLDEYEGHKWSGKLPVCYMACNSITGRGEGCGWSVSQKLFASGLPMIVSGRETSEMVDNGLGILDPKAMVNLYHNVRCYLAIGTMPAPYTLTLLEAMCSGTPVIAYDNGCGIVDEGFPVWIAKSVEEIIELVRVLCHGHAIAKIKSECGLEFAKKEFGMGVKAKEWWKFFEEIGV